MTYAPPTARMLARRNEAEAQKPLNSVLEAAITARDVAHAQHKEPACT